MNAPCIETAGNNDPVKWVEYYLVQTSAITAAYADLNADVAAGRVRCVQTFLPCPVQPLIYASAFASATFSLVTNGVDAYLGGPTVLNEHTVFPGYAQNPAVQNLQSYSFHTCDFFSHPAGSRQTRWRT